MRSKEKTLHVLTACSRPGNMEKVAWSLNNWPQDADFTWHVRFDFDRKHVGGQRLKNEMLDEISDGFVLFLDDDTEAHSEIWDAFLEHQDREAIVVSQHHEILGYLEAAPENVEVGAIDIGQVILRREAIGNHRIPETYAGDGEFLCAILPHVDAVYLDTILSIHNSIEEDL
jgi:hypothetical protein